MTNCRSAVRARNQSQELRATVLLLAAFWSPTFLINEGMSVLRDELPFHVAGGHRAAAFAFSAALALAVAHVLNRVGLDSKKQALCAGATILLMPPLHAIFFYLTCKVAPIPGVAPMTVEEAAVKALLSTGYFGAWIALQLALIYRHAVGAHSAVDPRLETLAPPSGQSPEKSYPASWRNQKVRVQAEEIRWVEAQKDYAVLHCANRSCIMRTTLSSLAAELPREYFVRVHRSAIVRKSVIAAVYRKPTGALALRTTCGAELPVGRSYAQSLRELPSHSPEPLQQTFVAQA